MPVRNSCIMFEGSASFAIEDLSIKKTFVWRKKKELKKESLIFSIVCLSLLILIIIRERCSDKNVVLGIVKKMR